MVKASIASDRGSNYLRSVDVQRRATVNYTIIKIQMGDEFKICPTCGYKDGFHSMFKKEEKSTKCLYICPSCHNVFDIGHTVNL